MEQTKNYQLSQWDGTDRILMEDFNADNAKVDAALKALSEQVERLGNCQTWTTSYQGSGDSGQTITLTFPTRPLVVVIGGPSQYLFTMYGCDWGVAEIKGRLQKMDVPCTFTGRTLSFTHSEYNQKVTYRVTAILQP